jgi:all-trans-retinol 13,14-reductase
MTPQSRQGNGLTDGNEGNHDPGPSSPTESRGDRTYDLILIGSGMGALTVASLMAQLRGKRVLVLERHFQPGGFTHEFKRQQFHWDVGLHYVGQMGTGSSTRQLFDLVTQRAVQWTRMADPFERFVYPDFTFDLYGNPRQFQADLVAQFPSEKRAIRRYFRALPKAAAAMFFRNLRVNGNWLLRWLSRLGQWWSGIGLDLTTQAYLDRHFTDPRLKALLTSQWGDYGLPPALSPFAVHATIVLHYLHGAYYPVGGAGTIAHSVVPIIEAQGGQVLVNREVTQVVIEAGRAVGVEVRQTQAPQANPETYYAPVIVSNTGAANTYLKLIPADYPIPFRTSLHQYVDHHASISHVTVYLGLADDPRKLGFRGENHWIYESLDHNATYRQRRQWTGETSAPQCYVSFPSLKDPQARHHTAEIIAWVDYNTFQPWQAEPWRHRHPAYQQLKQRMAQALIAQVERHYPGFADLVTYVELSTPLTTEHFTAHPKGGIYGLAIAPERFAPQNAGWTKVETPLPGLYLTGAESIWGASSRP